MHRSTEWMHHEQHTHKHLLWKKKKFRFILIFLLVHNSAYHIREQSAIHCNMNEEKKSKTYFLSKHLVGNVESNGKTKEKTNNNKRKDYVDIDYVYRFISLKKQIVVSHRKETKKKNQNFSIVLRSSSIKQTTITYYILL